MYMYYIYTHMYIIIYIFRICNPGILYSSSWLVGDAYAQGAPRGVIVCYNKLHDSII